VPSLIPGTDPLPELARALATTAAWLELNWSATDVRDRLEAGANGYGAWQTICWLPVRAHTSGGCW
jgi:hypothetical protein